MQEELDLLEERLDSMLALCARLHADNRNLRSRIAMLEGEEQRLRTCIDRARERVAHLIERLPT